MNLSPSKRTAAALESSPMFTPLEVKFKNMKVFENSAKKNMRSNKYPTIDVKEDHINRGDPVELELNNKPTLPRVSSLDEMRNH